jgi:hypothetical protein
VVKLLWGNYIAPSAALSIVCLVALGCGGNGKPKAYPVTGTVTLNGQPIEGASVSFFTQDELMRAARVPVPKGTTDASGQFHLTTYEKNDGAPAGSYKVAISWMQVTRPSDDPEEMVERDRLKGRYADTDKSGLTATVESGENQLAPFALK